MELVSRDDTIEALNECDDIKGYAYKSMHDKLMGVPTRAVIRECDGCFGASFNECTKCERLKETE